MNAGNGEWGRNMQNDLIDAVDWAMNNGIADPQQTAIMGQTPFTLSVFLLHSAIKMLVLR